jgi:hypothetical protein
MSLMFKRLAAFVLTLSLLSSLALAQKDTKTPSKAASFGNVEAVTAKRLKEHLSFIASDELEGRDTPSKGLDIAAMYIAQHLSSWGMKPAGDEGTYFQKFPLKRLKIDAQATKLRLNDQTFAYGDDFYSTVTNASVPASSIVYVGHGWVVKGKNINAYQGIDVKDKIVVVANNLPKGVTNADLQSTKPGVDWFSPPMYAQANGARAIIAFGSFNSLANWQATKWGQTEKGIVQYGDAAGQINIPTITASPALMSALFQGEKSSASAIFTRSVTQDFVEPFDLGASKKISLNVSVKSETVYTQNVVGILEGSDPVLKNEYVAIGAHYDHVGMNPFLPGPDKIYNGADDDGSGTVAVMNIAEAMAKGGQRPKRSILFIWHAGEEKGLWGSDYFTANPTVPLNSVITQLNVDMIGRFQNPGDENHPQNKNLPKPNEVFTIGNSMMSTELGQIADQVNKSYLNLNFNLKYDGPDHPEQFFYRSDHFNYAKRGVPIIFFMDGSHQDYHQVTDHIDKINFAEMEKVTRTILATGWTLANRDARPKVDKPLPASVIGAN